MMVMKKTFFILIFILFYSNVFAQSSAGYTGSVEPQYLIDKPTAGLIGKNNLGINIEAYRYGGLLLQATFGVFAFADIGLSYGGSNIIGPDDIKFYELPGIKIKIRAFEEKYDMPAIVVGFESQGRETYHEGYKRYFYKSPGFYVVASKNFKWLGFISYHLGLNYSLETNDGDKDMNLYLGLEKTIGDYISFLAEYDFGFNDDMKKFGQGKGYLHLGLNWYSGNGVTLSAQVKNLLNNTKAEKIAGRVAGIHIIQLF
jgi:hypothetical protein